MDSRSVAIPLLPEAGGALDHPASLALLSPRLRGGRFSPIGPDQSRCSGGSFGVFTMSDPGVHDADLGVHDGMILVFTME
jgi:hypothetical protein